MLYFSYGLDAGFRQLLRVNLDHIWRGLHENHRNLKREVRQISLVLCTPRAHVFHTITNQLSDFPFHCVCNHAAFRNASKKSSSMWCSCTCAAMHSTFNCISPAKPSMQSSVSWYASFLHGYMQYVVGRPLSLESGMGRPLSPSLQQKCMREAGCALVFSTAAVTKSLHARRQRRRYR